MNDQKQPLQENKPEVHDAIDILRDEITCLDSSLTSLSIFLYSFFILKLYFLCLAQ